MGVVIRLGNVVKSCGRSQMMIYGAVATPEEQTRFQREAEAVASFSTPSSFRFSMSGIMVDGRQHYGVVPGGSLAQKFAGALQPAGKPPR